jgi:bacterioferritin-associated ferredoxin
MYVCICREIKDSDFENEEDLLNRLKENDICCGKCIEEIEKDFDDINISVDF